MPEGSAEEKTEKPTARKRRQAREEGQVAHSAEVNNAVVLMAIMGALMLFGGGVFRTLTHNVSLRLGNLSGVDMSMDGAVAVLRDSARLVINAVMPIALFVGLFGLLASLLQTGPILAIKKLQPSLKEMNPINGAKQLFSLQALMRLVVALAKTVVICLVAYFILRSKFPWITSLAGRGPLSMLNVGCQLCLQLLGGIAVVMVVIAVGDFAYQRYSYEKKLMMTKTERKEERKREEGSDEMRKRQAERRFEVAQARMMEAVPTADVVVTNPTEIAVALKWDEEEMDAPQVVAKGRNILAERIKRIARENDVPILERKPVARALYKAVEVGMEIPPQLYYTVAEVLAFVMRQKKR